MALGRRGSRLANRAGLAFHDALRRVLSRLCRAFRRLGVLCPELLTPAMIGRRGYTGLTRRIGKALALRDRRIDIAQLGGDLRSGESLGRQIRT